MTNDEGNTYFTLAAINMCALAQSKTPFQPAIQANISMLVNVLANKHGRKIVGEQSALTQDQMIGISVAQTALRVDSFCGKSLPPEWKKEIDSIVSQVKKNSQSGAGSGGPNNK